MHDLHPHHGGTDSGPEPIHDFSTNANPLGPCPSVLAAMRGADLTRYPDPGYSALRARLARHHGVPPEHIVVGAGASELILRLVRGNTGSVQVLSPTFSEYGRCARVESRDFFEAESPAEFLRLQRQRPGLAFLCWPNNPTGARVPLDFVREAAHSGELVVDLAYAPLCPEMDLRSIEAAAAGAIRLYAPNKAFGLCGVRAAYLVTPRPVPQLNLLAPSWVIDRTAEAFLEASIQAESLAWLACSRPKIAMLRAELSNALTALGLEVRESPATFLMTRVENAPRIATVLRSHGIRVRDASSFGLSGWLRLTALRSENQRALLSQLARLVANRATSAERYVESMDSAKDGRAEQLK